MSTPALAPFADAIREPMLAAPAGLHARDPAERERRFAVHRNTHAATLVDALAGSFPVTRQLLGSDFFDAMALARLRRDPPRTPVLVDWALGFPAFADGFEALDTAPFARDVLHLEAMRIGAYHAADADPLPIDAVQRALGDPQGLASSRPRLHPAAAWRGFPHAALAIWQAHQSPQSLDEALAAIDVDAPEAVLVTRPDLDVLVHALQPGGIALLDALDAGEPLGAALLRADADGGDAVALLDLLLDAGAVVGLDRTEGVEA